MAITKFDIGQIVYTPFTVKSIEITETETKYMLTSMLDDRLMHVKEDELTMWLESTENTDVNDHPFVSMMD